MRVSLTAICSLAILTVPNLINRVNASDVITATNFPKTLLSQQISPSNYNFDQPSFNDIQGHWAQIFIEAMGDRGIMRGFTDGTFRPDKPLTRGDFANIIQTAFQNKRIPLGIVKGDPNQYITRVQALVTLTEGLNLAPQNIQKNTLSNYFQDASQIPIEATGNIAAAIENRLVVNYPDVKKLNPNRIATRGEIAAFIYQALVKTGEISPGENPAKNRTRSNPNTLSVPRPPKTKTQQINQISPLSNSPQIATSAITAQAQDYTLGAGDRIRLDFITSPEYSGEYQILVNDTINLPLIGGISVKGMTLRQAAAVISTAYSRLIRDPQVTVSLLNPRPVQIAIAGEVNRPGSYTVSLASGTENKNTIQLPKLTQAIKNAGGFTQAANLRQVLVRRPQKFGPEQIIPVDLWALLQAGDLSQDMTLRDGDTIFIPTANNLNLAESPQLAAASFAADKSQPITVAVVGEVARPGSYLVKANEIGDRPTLTIALQTAGGVTQAADVRFIQVRRPTKTGTDQIINVDLWQLLQAGDLRQNLILEQGDTIFIPTANEVNLAQNNQLAATNIAADKTQPLSVAVVGEVLRPGPYTIKADEKGSLPTLTKAIQTAGGITQTADIRQIQLRRPTRTGTEQVFNLNLWQLLQAGDLRQDMALQQGDTIVIPTATALNPAEATQLAAASFSPNIIKVNVVGEVTKPGTVEVPPNTPLNQALLAAGGFNNRARKASVDLIRLNPDGTVFKRSLDVDFAKGINDKNNPSLRQNDVIVVGRSGLTQVSDTLGNILSPIGGIFSLFNFFRIFQ